MTYAIDQSPFAYSGKFAGRHIHIGLSGSVACYKTADILRALLRLQTHVSCTLTRGARQFTTPLLFRALGATPVHDDMFVNPDETFAHLDPGTMAEVLLVCPASANILARLAHGLASDMLSTQALAFTGPVVIAPAMNPRMWSHPATQENVRILKNRGACFVGPDAGGTACGESGEGRLAQLPHIFLTLLKALSPQDMRGLTVLVTLGPTREPWDGARFWSNPSSGLMGAALATCAWLRGAEVTAICGPSAIYLPPEINRINVMTAIQMLEAALKVWPQTNIGCFCAAVADFAPARPEQADQTKIKKSALGASFSLAFNANPDILGTLAAERGNNQKIMGFAAEITADLASLAPLAHEKRAFKNADLLAANRVNGEAGAFGAEDSALVVVDKNGTEEIWSCQPKADSAWDLFSWLLKL